MRGAVLSVWRGWQTLEDGGDSRRFFGRSHRACILAGLFWPRGGRAPALSEPWPLEGRKGTSGRAKVPSVQPRPRFLERAKIFRLRAGGISRFGRPRRPAPAWAFPGKIFAASFLRGQVRTARRLGSLTRFFPERAFQFPKRDSPRGGAWLPKFPQGAPGNSGFGAPSPKSAPQISLFVDRLEILALRLRDVQGAESEFREGLAGNSPSGRLRGAPFRALNEAGSAQPKAARALPAAVSGVPISAALEFSEILVSRLWDVNSAWFALDFQRWEFLGLCWKRSFAFQPAKRSGSSERIAQKPPIEVPAFLGRNRDSGFSRFAELSRKNRNV